MVVVTDDILQRVAEIIGPNSAAERALQELRRRRAIGEDPVCVQVDGSFVVVDRRKVDVSEC